MTYKFTSSKYIKSNGKVAIQLIVRSKDKRQIKKLFEINPRHWNEIKERVYKSSNDYDYYNSIIENEIARIKEIVKYNSNVKTSKLINGTSHKNISNDVLLSAACLEYAKVTTFSAQRKYEDLAKKIIEYNDVYVSMIDKKYFIGYITFLKSYKSINSQTTINRYAGFLKTILRQYNATYPLLNECINYTVKSGTTNKTSLSKDEFRLIEQCEIEELTKDTFCSQVYLRGRRISDVLCLRNENIEGNRITFLETKGQKKSDILIIPKMQIIIDKYKGMSRHGYILPIIDVAYSNPRKDKSFSRKIESKTAILNVKLKLIAAICGIKKNLTTHVARHSFAHWLDDSGIDSRTIQNMFNHSRLETTELYLKSLRSNNELDKAANDVFDGM